MNLSIRHILLALTVAVGGLTLASTASAKPFTMTCTSANTMSLDIKAVPAKFKLPRGVPGALFSQRDQLIFAFKFKNGTVGANQRKPRPGECVWQHRPLQKKEMGPAWFRANGMLQGRIAGRRHSLAFPSPQMNKLAGYMGRPGTTFSMIVAFVRPRGKKPYLRIERVH